MMSLFGKKKILGLDIGSSSIKMAELDVSKNSATLLAFGMLPTPPNTVVAGDISDSGLLGQTIRELAFKIKTKRKEVATGMAGTSVIVKRISIPRVDEKLIAEQIRWEAEQYIPFDINEVNLAYQVLKTTPASSDNLDLLLIAAVQAHVFKYAEAIGIAGFNCSILDVGGFALMNCFNRNYGDMGGQTVGLLNIGCVATSMVVVENGEVVFSRDIPVGGANYTTDLQKTLNVSHDEAESMKLSISKGQAAPEEANNVIQATHDLISEEFKASIDFYLNSSRGQQVGRFFITGGGSKTAGLFEKLTQVVPCEKLDPFFGVKANSKAFSKDYLSQISDYAAVAIGLGLRQVGDE